MVDNSLLGSDKKDLELIRKVSKSIAKNERKLQKIVNTGRDDVKIKAVINLLSVRNRGQQQNKEIGEFSMKQKTILITGTSSGIGAALVDKFALENWNVISAMRTPVKDPRDNVTVVRMDITDKETIKAGIDLIIAKFGALDVVINNAGYGNRFALFEEMANEELLKQMDTNLWGAVDLCREALPHMRKAGSGRIINVTSVAGTVGFPYNSGYGASKFALRGFSLCLAEEVSRYGIHVTSVEPGAIRTRIANSAHSARDIEIPELNDHAKEVQAFVEKSHKIYASKMVTEVETVAQRLFKLANRKNPPPVFYPSYDATMMAWIRRLFSVRRVQQILAGFL
ncbi:MAG: SDR family oxidoreductase [Ostreibacterium sp.]